MKRRDALKTMGALAGATAGTRLLGACGDNGLPPGIEHVVVVMMENRSCWAPARSRGWAATA